VACSDWRIVWWPRRLWAPAQLPSSLAKHCVSPVGILSVKSSISASVICGTEWQYLAPCLPARTTRA
jgi:hypothetical protein